MLRLGLVCNQRGRRRAKPEVLIRGALEAAEQFSGGVRGPFHIVKVEE